MRMILGVRFGHDASAALIIDGKIIVDVAEERFTRKKNDGSFPVESIRFCLKQAGVTSLELDAITFPTESVLPEFRAVFPRQGQDDPAVESEEAPRQSKKAALLSRLSRKLGLYDEPVSALRPNVPELPVYFERFPIREDCQFVPVTHHLAHAASAYYTSGLNDEKALIVSLDGRGDYTSTAIWRGRDNKIELLRKWDDGSSLAWFYAAATEALGWRHGSDEWKVMGLAPYGTPRPGALDGFHPVFEKGELTQPHDFGAVSRWPDHGTNHYHLPDANKLAPLVEKLGREDFSAEVQRIAEEQGEALIYHWLEREGTRHLCCAGGFFLNVKLNGRIWSSGKVDTHWIYPNPGDGGLAAGAALYVFYQAIPDQRHERLRTVYLGPEFTNEEIEALLQERKIPYERHEAIWEVAARLLAENRIIAWFQGRMEAGPRALGNRSILMSPLKAENKDVINACVKYREAFRPFCPSLLSDRREDYLACSREECFMITSFDATPEKRDRIPAVVHVDGTVRPQTVRRNDNPRYYDLIEAFGRLTGEPIVLNTSFNVKGEPIVCHPREAIRCFYDTGLDALIMGDFLLKKPNLD